MLKWCSYCQQLMHEIAPYDDLGITHGMCGDCKPKHLDAHVEPDLTHARFVGAIQSRLAEAGWRNDLAAAEAVIATCGAANMRGVDILVGVIAPLLYQIGRDWELGLITVADEHRFTRFCEDVFTIIVRTRGASLVHAEGESGQRVDTLLMNAPGNSHTLAMRMLVLWLADKGMAARVLTRPLSIPDLVILLGSARPRRLLISLALVGQVAGVVEIIEGLAALPGRSRPRIIVGGHAVKHGLVAPIPGAELLADINFLT
jgi:hypothetical protein